MTEGRAKSIENKIDKVLDNLIVMNKEVGKHGADIDNLKKSYKGLWAIGILILTSAANVLYASINWNDL